MVFQIEKVGKLIEVIDTFSFREDGTISIPKSKREKAYQQSVDIIVQSVSYPQYKNGKGLPSISFYGYAVLVFQDCLSLEIPIHYPRQRIWFDRQWQAQQSWQDEVKFWENYQFHRKNDISLASIMGALEIPYNEIDFYFKDMAFVELPLREVYIKLLSHSQFQIEYTQIEPVPYDDPFGNTRDGKSGQEDGDKDAGLPKEGIQPSENPSDDPYQGNPPLSVPSFESGFSNINDGLEEASADNEAGTWAYNSLAGGCVRSEGGLFGSKDACEASLVKKWEVTLYAVFNDGSGCTNNAPVGQIVVLPFENNVYTIQTPLLDMTCGGTYGIKVIGVDGLAIAPTGCFNGVTCGTIGAVEPTITTREILAPP